MILYISDMFMTGGMDKEALALLLLWVNNNSTAVWEPSPRCLEGYNNDWKLPQDTTPNKSCNVAVIYIRGTVILMLE